MAIIKLVCTRNTDSANLTFGKGVYGALTVTGEIYDAEDYNALVMNDYNIPEKVDLSASLIKCVATVSFRGNQETYDAIQTKVAAYFKELAEQNIFDIKVGLIIKSAKISSPVKGMHPTLNIPTMTVLINNAELIEVEEPELLEFAEDLVNKTVDARENAKERSAVSLGNYLKAGLKKSAATLGKSLFTELSTNAAEQLHKETKGKVGRPPKVKTEA